MKKQSRKQSKPSRDEDKTEPRHLYRVDISAGVGGTSYYIEAENFGDAEARGLRRANREYTIRADVKCVEYLAYEVTRG